MPVLIILKELKTMNTIKLLKKIILLTLAAPLILGLAIFVLFSDDEKKIKIEAMLEKMKESLREFEKEYDE
jgi:hypothetical protein